MERDCPHLATLLRFLKRAEPSAELITARWAARFGEPEDYQKAMAEYQKALSSEAPSDLEPEYALVLCPECRDWKAINKDGIVSCPCGYTARSGQWAVELDETTRGRN